jgi:hypothetical protein
LNEPNKEMQADPGQENPITASATPTPTKTAAIESRQARRNNPIGMKPPKTSPAITLTAKIPVSRSQVMGYPILSVQR